MNACFSIRKGYKSAVVYHFKSDGEITGILTTIPDKGLTKRERYDAIAKSFSYSKIKAPDFDSKQ